MNKLLVGLAPHLPKRITDLAGRDDYINLAVGVPNFHPPKSMLAYLKEYAALSANETNLHIHRYGDFRGLLELRKAIAFRYDEKYATTIDPEQQLIITNGAAAAIWLAIFVSTSIGDQVIIPDPCYMLYESIVTSLGRQAIRLATEEKDNFAIDIHKLEKIMTHKTKLIIINSPTNPTGTVYSEALLSMIVDLSIKKNIYLLHDEVCDDFVFSAKHCPIVSLAKKNTNLLGINSFSKKYGVAGWRIGWLTGPPHFIEQALKAHTFSSITTHNLMQHVLAHALADPIVEHEVSANSDYLQQNAQLFRSLITKTADIQVDAQPKGGIFIFPRISQLYQRLPSAYQVNSCSESVANFLFDQAKIATMPGHLFGKCGDNHLRISIANPRGELIEAAERINNLFCH